MLIPHFRLFSPAFIDDIIWRMNSAYISRHPRFSYLLQIALVLAIVFSAWHVASHDIDIQSDASNAEECQTCILNHIPIADLPTPTWFIPLMILSLGVIFPAIRQPSQFRFFSFGARAPPCASPL